MLVHNQGELIDDIEKNMENAHDYVKKAEKKL
jgi:hypothetical protein